MFNKPVSSPVVIGRQVEVEHLHAHIDQVRQGHGQVVLLSGEAGIGKSRLAAEVKAPAQVHGFLALQGNCFPGDRSSPYAPLLDLFGSSQAKEALSLSAASPELPTRELALLLPGFLPLSSNESQAWGGDPDQEKRRLFVALAQLFMTLASIQPVLLVIEDVHWSDETSLEFLHYLARRSVGYPLLIVLTYRHDEIHSELRHWLAQLDREHLAQEYILRPLSRGDVDAMLQTIFDRPNPVPSATLEAIYVLTEGNPYFIEEVLKSLISTGIDVSGKETWDSLAWNKLPIPRTVEDAVQRRLDQLSESARQVLLLAAVAGRRFDFAVLQRITHHNEPELLGLMKELILAQLVVEASEDEFAFRHALTREAISRQLLRREQKARHHTLAETIEDIFAATLDAHLAEIAYHFYEAGDWEKALSYAQRAGERALALYAPRAAIEQFTTALKASHHVAAAPLAPLYRLRGHAYETLGDFEHARSDYERASTVALEAFDGRIQWQAVMDLGVLWAGREYERAGAYFRQAVDLAQRLEDAILRAHSLNRLGNWLVNTGQVAEGLQVHQQALDVFQTRQDQVGMAQTLDLLGMSLAWTGNYVAGRQQHERATTLFRQLGDKKGLVSILPNAGITASPGAAETTFVVVHSPDESAHDAAEAVALAREIDWPAGEAYAELTAGLVLASFGRFGQGLAHVYKGLQIATEIEHQQWIIAAHSNLGQIYVLMLESTLALHHLETGLPLAQQLGSAWWMESMRAYQALAHLLAGHHKQAEAALRSTMPREQEPHTLTERRLSWAWGQLAFAQGEPQVALQIAERLIASAPGSPGTQPIPRLLKLKGEALVALKRPNEAIEALEGAQLGAQERQEGPLLWQIHGLRGQVYRLLKREGEASDALAAAREGIESLGHAIDDAEVREHFLQRALAALPKARALSRKRAVADKYGGLTDRERDVAKLIAKGKTSRQIASVLVISERTAEGHVNNILGKLGFTSRAQVAAWVVEHGLANG